MPVNIASGRFRANRSYELVPTERLTAEQRAALPGLDGDPDLYGLLVPREPGAGGLKAVDRDTALLFLTLATPGPLPAYMHAAEGTRTSETAARLVLDGVLEIEAEGRFVTGAAARDAVGLAAADTGEGRIASLSRDALRCAEAMEADEAGPLAALLYGYNREPLTPEWSRRLPDRAAVEAFAGLSEGGAPTRALAPRWTTEPNGAGHWISWRSRTPGRSGDAGQATYKLYVSPRAASLPEALPATAEAAGAAGAFSLKVGADVYGILRSDKLVAYFRSFEALAEAARAVTERLGGCLVQGVPFTAQSDGEGLVSWGMDPPARSFGGAESWRLWLTSRLASAILAGRAAGAPEAWRFALQRVQVEGVDPATWSPSLSIWREATA